MTWNGAFLGTSSPSEASPCSRKCQPIRSSISVATPFPTSLPTENPSHPTFIRNALIFRLPQTAYFILVGTNPFLYLTALNQYSVLLKNALTQTPSQNRACYRGSDIVCGDSCIRVRSDRERGFWSWHRVRMISSWTRSSERYRELGLTGTITYWLAVGTSNQQSHRRAFGYGEQFFPRLDPCISMRIHRYRCRRGILSYHLGSRSICIEKIRRTSQLILRRVTLLLEFGLPPRRG
jgi:hypothetical protein